MHYKSSLTYHLAMDDDPLLDKTQQFLNQDTSGDIIIARNRVAASIFQFNPRGSSGSAQGYKIQNHIVGTTGSNITPNQSPLYGTGLGTALNASQNVQYGTNVPLSGDILLKGSFVGIYRISWMDLCILLPSFLLLTYSTSR